MENQETRNVLVTTEYRGVFFGELVELDGKEKTAVLANAQNCISWGSDMHGVFGLAVIGPTVSCRIGPVVKQIELYGITSVSDVAPSAAENWRKCPWK